MHLTHLTLNHFRNYHTLEIDFSGALTILQGDNAQGKTNLLEAIYFLATSKPVHAQSEREVVGWSAADEPIPYSRIAGTVVERIDIPVDDQRLRYGEMVPGIKEEDGHWGRTLPDHVQERQALALKRGGGRNLRAEHLPRPYEDFLRRRGLKDSIQMFDVDGSHQIQPPNSATQTWRVINALGPRCHGQFTVCSDCSTSYVPIADSRHFSALEAYGTNGYASSVVLYSGVGIGSRDEIR